jgi:hypothetical protein
MVPLHTGIYHHLCSNIPITGVAGAICVERIQLLHALSCYQDSSTAFGSLLDEDIPLLVVADPAEYILLSV